MMLIGPITGDDNFDHLDKMGLPKGHFIDFNKLILKSIAKVSGEK